MKKQILIFILALLVVCASSVLAYYTTDGFNDGITDTSIWTQYSPVGACEIKEGETQIIFIPNQDLWLLYHLDNNSAFGENDDLVYDFSPIGDNGTPTGQAVPVTAGKYGGAYQFGDGNSVIQGQNNDDKYPNQDFTIMAWVKTYSLGAGNERVIVGRHLSGSVKNFKVGLDTDDTLYFQTYASCGSGSTSLNSPQTINANQWYHVTAVMDSGTIKRLYVNGIEVTNSTSTANVPSGCPSNITIGCNNANPANHWNGTIDDVAIWNRTLTSNEILATYNSGTPINKSVISGSVDVSYGYVNATANGSCGGTNSAQYVTVKSKEIPSSADATVTVKEMIAGDNMPNNRQVGVCVREGTANGHSSSPPASCGICIEAKKNGFGGQLHEWTVSRTYPSASALVNCNDTVGLQYEDIQIDVSRGTNQTNYLVYFRDVLCWNETQTGACQNPALNTSLFISGVDTGGFWGRFEDFTIFSTSGEEGFCSEPCIFNETFPYDDNLCNHGWVVGDCNDINLPENGHYVCDGSDEVLAHYFGKITKDSGIIDLQYDLNILSDYEVLWGVGSEAEQLVLGYYYRNGTIKDLRDETTIGTYTFDTIHKYKVSIDLENYNYDFYVDNVLTGDDIPFYTYSDDIFYFFIQPDYNKGYPYCDYILDNVEISKQIAITPPIDRSGTFGTYWNATGFNQDLACRETENPTLCFFRASFQDFIGGFSTFLFANFILFLVLLSIIIIIILLKRANR